jgi:hypothetical protein
VIDPASGVLTWRPAVAQSPSTNLFSVAVSDSGSPALGASQNIRVTVAVPARPTLLSPMFSNNQFTFSITGNSGPDYCIDTASNLTGSTTWSPLWTNYAPTTFPFIWTDAAATGAPQRYYRVRLGP